MNTGLNSPNQSSSAEPVRRRRPVVHMSVIGTLVPGVKEEMIFRCIESLLETTAQSPFDVRVTAIDNSPAPGLGGRLRTRFPMIEVIENKRRQGYAANHNMAMAGSDADYQLLCNDDLVFQPRTLDRAVSYLEDSRNAGVAVIAFQFLNPDGSVQHSTFAFPTVPRGLLGLSGLRAWVPFSGWTLGLARLLGRAGGRSRFWAHDRVVAVETFLGAAMLVRASAAREVGPMDEVSLLGVEETEWHRRFWERGWKIMFLPDAPIIHYGSQTLKVMQIGRAT